MCANQPLIRQQYVFLSAKYSVKSPEEADLVISHPCSKAKTLKIISLNNWSLPSLPLVKHCLKEKQLREKRSCKFPSGTGKESKSICVKRMQPSKKN